MLSVECVLSEFKPTKSRALRVTGWTSLSFQISDYSVPCTSFVFGAPTRQKAVSGVGSWFNLRSISMRAPNYMSSLLAVSSQRSNAITVMNCSSVAMSPPTKSDSVSDDPSAVITVATMELISKM